MKFLYSRSGRPSGNHNDCTVRAIVNCTALTYPEAHDILSKAGRKHNRGFRTSLWLGHQKQVSEFVFRRVVGWNIDNGPASYGCYLSTFLREFPKGRFLVGKSGHVFAVVDGTVIDMERQPPRCRIKNAWEVTML